MKHPLELSLAPFPHKTMHELRKWHSLDNALRHGWDSWGCPVQLDSAGACESLPAQDMLSRDCFMVL